MSYISTSGLRELRPQAATLGVQTKGLCWCLFVGEDVENGWKIYENLINWTGQEEPEKQEEEECPWASLAKLDVPRLSLSCTFERDIFLTCMSNVSSKEMKRGFYEVVTVCNHPLGVRMYTTVLGGSVYATGRSHHQNPDISKAVKPHNCTLRLLLSWTHRCWTQPMGRYTCWPVAQAMGRRTTVHRNVWKTTAILGSPNFQAAGKSLEVH